MLRLVLLVSVCFAACANAPGRDDYSIPPSPGTVVGLDAEGLRIIDGNSGATQAIPFGTSTFRTSRAVTRVLSVAGRSENQECGAGPIQFVDTPVGLQLAFQDDAFVGWWLDTPDGGDPPGLSTLDGLGIGTARADFDALGTAVSVQETSLGTEFAAGGVYGLLSGPEPSARVTDLWAGVSCTFR